MKENNFYQHIQELCPLLFNMDNHNYARYLSVYFLTLLTCHVHTRSVQFAKKLQVQYVQIRYTSIKKSSWLDYCTDDQSPCEVQGRHHCFFYLFYRKNIIKEGPLRVFCEESHSKFFKMMMHHFMVMIPTIWVSFPKCLVRFAFSSTSSVACDLGDVLPFDIDGCH